MDLLIALAVFGGLALVIYLITVYFGGALDGEYPEVARHDYHRGPLRRVYLAGRRHGERTKERARRRRIITMERRNAEREG